MIGNFQMLKDTTYLIRLNLWHTVHNGAYMNGSLINIIFSKNCKFGDIN